MQDIYLQISQPNTAHVCMYARLAIRKQCEICTQVAF